MPEQAKQDTDAKVVHLEPESQRIVRAKLARLPAAVHAVHEKGKFLVLGLLKGFFDRVDDSLFELADKAQSNQEQNLYFDSMREVRVQRRGIEKRFNDAIDNAFADLISNEPTPQERNSQQFSADTLSLVENDELDEIVAVDASVSKANTEFGESAQLISLRLDSLMPVKVYQKNNPFGPDMICAAFMAEAKKLDVGIKAKLVLFKLFDKTVVSKLGDVYESLNSIFRDHNILPSLTPNSGKTRKRADARPVSLASSQEMPAVADIASEIPGATGANVSPEVLSTLKNMLGERVLANPAASTKTQAAAGELMQLLSRIQHMPAMMDNRVAINVRALLDQLQQQSGVNTKIGQVDDQVMNLVNMLFDFILEDRNLAPPMKALISRMQIPIIKVAVADKSFFTNGNHVARRLLNEMASAAMGWNAEQASQNDPLYKKIETIVRALIENFETDLNIFSELLMDFTAFLEKEKKRAAVMERRTLDAEDGKAKAEVARTTVEIEVEIRTIGLPLPKVVIDMVKNAWSNVLFVTALKYGYDAPEWHEQLEVLEELVWSTQPPRDAQQRQKLIKLVPGLLKKLRAGLDTISYNPFEMSDIFKSLEKVHIDCIRGRAQPKPKAPVAKKDAAPVSPEERLAPSGIDESTSAPSVSTPAQQRKRPVPRKPAPDTEPVSGDLPAPSLQDLARGVELSEIDEVDRLLSDSDESAVEDSPSPAPQHTAPVAPGLPADDPYMRQVASFSQGTWFDMDNERGERTRCRLAALIKPTGKYIFVNRSGMKVAEYSQEDLALMIKNNTLSSLDDTMLFDRALETVVTGLRKA